MKVLVLLVLFYTVSFAQKTENEIYANFTTSERLGTWALNHITLNSGLGSFIIMKDYLGGGFLLGSFIVTGVSYFKLLDSDLSDPDFGIYGGVALSSLFFGTIWNIYRSVTYDKPHYYALIDHRYLKVFAMPSQDGKSLMPGLFYNVRF